MLFGQKELFGQLRHDSYPAGIWAKGMKAVRYFQWRIMLKDDFAIIGEHRN